MINESLKNYKLNNTISFLIVFSLIASLFAYFPFTAKAASVTAFSDTLTSIKASTLANHTILFTTPTGVASGQTIVLTFNNSTSIPAAFDFEDMDLADDGVEVALAATPSGSTWGAARTSGTVITFTNGNVAVAGGSVIRIKLGTNAVVGSTGAEQITNGSVGTTILALSGTFTDTGSAAMPIVSDDQVLVTATVDPTITFSLSANAIEFGSLSASQATWADASAGSTTDVVAHTMAIGTNASGGYAITYNGATLTSGLNTINVASINNDANGTPGTEEFGLSISTDGDCTIASGYNHADPDWTWVASTATTICSETAPTATETISARYIANIAANTEAGSYATTVTYIATGTF